MLRVALELDRFDDFEENAATRAQPEGARTCRVRRAREIVGSGAVGSGAEGSGAVGSGAVGSRSEGETSTMPAISSGMSACLTIGSVESERGISDRACQILLIIAIMRVLLHYWRACVCVCAVCVCAMDPNSPFGRTPLEDMAL